MLISSSKESENNVEGTHDKHMQKSNNGGFANCNYTKSKQKSEDSHQSSKS